MGDLVALLGLPDIEEDVEELGEQLYQLGITGCRELASELREMATDRRINKNPGSQTTIEESLKPVYQGNVLQTLAAIVWKIGGEHDVALHQRQGIPVEYIKTAARYRYDEDYAWCIHNPVSKFIGHNGNVWETLCGNGGREGEYESYKGDGVPGGKICEDCQWNLREEGFQP